jgi:hypothetical protein
MRQSSSGDKYSYDWMRRFDRAVGQINVVLAALAIGLAVLDVTCLIALTAIAEVKRANHPARQVELSFSQARPEWFQLPPTPALTNAAMRTADVP